MAVISLPPGVFNPYSGVKTSILILDKSIARQSENILFIKIETEGTDLAARRRATEGSDLPQAEIELNSYLKAIRSQQPTTSLKLTLGLVVPKSEIAANGDYNLSGERYREEITNLSTFPLAKIGELFELSGKDKVGSQSIPVMSITMKEGLVDQSQKFKKRIASEDISLYKRVLKNELVVGFPIDEGVLGFLTQYEAGAVSPAYGIWRIRPEKRDVVKVEFLELVLRSPRAITAYRAKMQGAVSRRRSVPSQIFTEIPIPLPPLEVQKEIVAEIEGYQKVIDGARAVLDNYRPHIPIHPDWPLVRLAEVCETITDGDHLPPPKASDGVPFVTISNINDDHQLDFTKTFFVPEAYYAKLSPSRRPKAGDILYTVTGSYGIPVLVNSNARFCFQRHIALIRTGPQLLNTFLYSLLASPFLLQQGDAAATGVAQKTVSLTSLRDFSIPLPPLAIQQAIAAGIEAEQALVAANRELIARFEKKIQATLARVWGEDAPAAPEA
jgi:type I restriction enzyme M protein